MDQTALLAPVPRVGPLIQPWRQRHDPSAALGMPPHVTVLAPFLAPDEVTVGDLDVLRGIMAGRDPIELDLATVGMFEGDVLHLRPDPDQPLRDLTAAVHAQFPRVPPYGGRHAEVVPHVTVGHAIPRPSARHAARALMLALPVRVRIDVVQLWVGTDGAWTVAASFPLGTQVAARALSGVRQGQSVPSQLASRRRPTAPDFSGWNWVPTTLASRTRHGNPAASP